LHEILYNRGVYSVQPTSAERGEIEQRLPVEEIEPERLFGDAAEQRVDEPRGEVIQRGRGEVCNSLDQVGTLGSFDGASRVLVVGLGAKLVDAAGDL
jgi:hypothetical protein